MKKLFFFLITLLFADCCIAQNFSKTISVCSGSYTYSGAVQPDKSIQVTITDISDATKKVQYSYSGTDISDFATVFQNQFLKISGITCSSSDNNVILAEGNKLWYQLVSTYPAPKAGALQVANKLTIYTGIKDSNGKPFTLKDCTVQEVHVEMNSGYIETIYTIVSVHGVPRTYINIFGIGFTSFENFAKLSQVNLYELHKKPFPKKEDTDSTKPTYTYIKLSELLKYNPELEVDRRDYSPKDTAFTLNGGQNIILYKQETTKLFEAHIFSDFIGLQENQPNGLIQTEVAKRINVNSIQWKSPRVFYWLFKSFGITQYIAPVVTFSKIEAHNKRLMLGDLDSIRFNPGSNDTSSLNKACHRYVTPLDLFQHQSFSAGADWNVLYFSNHSLKYNVYIGFGTYLGITPVTDSLTSVSQNTVSKTGAVNEYSVNTLQLKPECRLVFLPEERFNFSIAYQLLFIKPFSPNIQLLTFDKDDPTKFKTTGNNWLNSYELLLTFNTSAISKLFGRLRFNSELHNYNNNFAQIQVGYSTYILGHQ
jgi:hypothetical protein